MLATVCVHWIVAKILCILLCALCACLRAYIHVCVCVRAVLSLTKPARGHVPSSQLILFISLTHFCGSVPWNSLSLFPKKVGCWMAFELSWTEHKAGIQLNYSEIFASLCARYFTTIICLCKYCWVFKFHSTHTHTSTKGTSISMAIRFRIVAKVACDFA